MKHLLRKIALLAALLCRPSYAPPSRCRWQRSFSILADLVRQIGGERVSVTALVGPDEDAHAFQPPLGCAPAEGRPRGFANGLGFDTWMERLARAAGVTEVVIASAGLAAGRRAPRWAMVTAHDHGGRDPHAWQDPRNVTLYADNIQAALSAADPAGSDAYRRNADAFKAALQELDAKIRRAVASLPPERRRVVTSHDAFGYFASAYGLGSSPPVGLGSRADPSAASMAALIRQIRGPACRRYSSRTWPIQDCWSASGARPVRRWEACSIRMPCRGATRPRQATSG